MKRLFLFLLFVVAVMAVPVPCSAMLSFGYVSKSKAEAEGLELRWGPAGPDGVWVQLTFKTDGAWKEFAKPQRSNYVDLRMNGSEANAYLVRAALREDRGTAGQVSVSFTADRAKLHHVELWLIRYLPGVADVVRMKDFIDLDKIDRSPEERDRAAEEQAPAGDEAGPPPAATEAPSDPATGER